MSALRRGAEAGNSATLYSMRAFDPTTPGGRSDRTTAGSEKALANPTIVIVVLGENGRCAEAITAGQNCGDILIPPFGTGMFNMPIGALITGIGQRAGRPIVDKTQLTGRYDVNITWLPDGVKLEDLNLEDVPPEFRPQDMSLPEALERQAGLKLEAQRAAMPVLVIDSISQPDPN
jgi:uncharacterized protein (TIGR03435 family)